MRHVHLRVLLILPGFLLFGGGGGGVSELAVLLELARRCCSWRAVTGRILLGRVCLEAAAVRDRVVAGLRMRERVASLLLIARARDAEEAMASGVVGGGQLPSRKLYRMMR